MDYKKIVGNQDKRLKILNLLSWVPDSVMLRIQYRIKFGFWPDFKHPRRYTEKIQLYKMKYRNPIMGQCVDKYEVRAFVEGKGLGDILNQCYGIYDDANDIDIDSLPKSFVAKTTDGGGGLNVIIVRDKNKIDEEQFKKDLNHWKGNLFKLDPGREWAYTQMKSSRIIVEALLEDDTTGDGSIDDYKLMCFNGKFRCLWVDKGRYSDHHRGFWDENLKFLKGVYSDHDTFDTPPVLPENMKEMVSIAEKLSEDFPYARVDLYNIKGKIYFGEITFYPWSGYVKFTPDEFDYTLGSFFTEY